MRMLKKENAINVWIIAKNVRINFHVNNAVLDTNNLNKNASKSINII